jgi:hypothetical protein
VTTWPASWTGRRLAGRAVRLTAGRIRGVSLVLRIVHFVAAVVELVAAPSARRAAAATVRGIALAAPRAARILALLPWLRSRTHP